MALNNLDNRINKLDTSAQLELYRLKCELLEQNLTQYKKREDYWMSQNTYMLESINSKLNGSRLSSIFVCTDQLSPINLTPDFIKTQLTTFINENTMLSFSAIVQSVYKSLIFTENGYKPKVIVSNKNGSLKYILNGKIFCDVKLVYFTSLIYESLKTISFNLLNNDIENKLFLNTFMKIKNLKINNMSFRKLLVDFIQDEN
jgi:hypothetical protein